MKHIWFSVLAVDYSRVPVISAVLLAAALACAEIGYRRGKKRAGDETYRASTDVVTGALVTVLALLLGFSFGAAETRFDRRRQMIVEEANAIGTAYLRVDMLPARDQTALRSLFREYLDKRLEAYGSVPDVEKAMSKVEQASDLSGKIWKQAERASRRDKRLTTELLLLPAINRMIDISAARKAVLLQHLPSLIIALLAGLSLACSVMIGYRLSAGKRNLLSAILFATVVSATFYVILDFEFPRFGLIRLDPEDKILLDLRKDLREK